MDLSKLSDDELRALYAKSVPQAPQEAKDGILSALGHGLGLDVRAGVKGVTGLPGALANVTTVPLLNAAVSPFTDRRFGDQNKVVDQNLTTMGVPEPQNGMERVGVDALSAATGAGGVAKVAGKVAEAAPGVMQQIAQLLSRNVGTQVAAGGAAGAGGSVAREAGAGPMVQTIAALLSGIGVPAAGNLAGRMGGHAIEPYTDSGITAIKNRTLNTIVGDRRQGVIDALGSSRSIVPGSNPTAAEAAVPAGSTELSGLEKLLAGKYDPSGYRDIKTGAEAARQAAEESGQTLGLNVDRGRAALNEEMGRTGAPRAADLLGQSLQMGQHDVPPMLERKVMILRAIMNRLTGTATERALVPLTQDMKDPAVVRELLLKAGPEEKPALMEQLARLLAGTAQGGAQTNGGQ